MSVITQIRPSGTKVDKSCFKIIKMLRYFCVKIPHSASKNTDSMKVEIKQQNSSSTRRTLINITDSDEHAISSSGTSLITSSGTKKNNELGSIISSGTKKDIGIGSITSSDTNMITSSGTKKDIGIESKLHQMESVGNNVQSIDSNYCMVLAVVRPTSSPFEVFNFVIDVYFSFDSLVRVVESYLGTFEKRKEEIITYIRRYTNRYDQIINQMKKATDFYSELGFRSVLLQAKTEMEVSVEESTPHSLEELLYNFRVGSTSLFVNVENFLLLDFRRLSTRKYYKQLSQIFNWLHNPAYPYPNSNHQPRPIRT